MAILCCTAKLLKELRFTPTPPDPSGLEQGRLGAWYGNLLRIDRRKCLLFTNARTLYSFFVGGVTRPALDSPDELFRSELAAALTRERVSSDTMAEVLDEHQGIDFTSTSSRSVLGSMNDFAFMLTTHIRIDGGLAQADLEHLHFWLNETPMSAIGMDHPRRRFLALLGEESAGMPDPRRL